MTSCRDCKHWGTVPYEYFEDADEGQAVGDENTSFHRICGRIRLLEFQSNPHPRRAFTRDGSGYKADLWTAPDFGCTLGEPR